MIDAVIENEYLAIYSTLNMRRDNECRWKKAGYDLLDDAISNLNIPLSDKLAFAQWMIAIRKGDEQAIMNIPHSWKQALMMALFSYPGEEKFMDPYFQKTEVISSIIGTKRQLLKNEYP